MDELWSLIGLSSLIASIVTVILGTFKDILVDKYRFNRESEAGYIQSQVRLFSNIYFLIQRIEMRAYDRRIFISFEKGIVEFNEVLKDKLDLLGSEVLNEWLSIMALFGRIFEEENKEKRSVLLEQNYKNIANLKTTVKNKYNELIIRYRKLVGETAQKLD